MTGSETKVFVETGLLDGGTINDTFFYQLLNIAKEKLENERDWKILETDDSSQTASTSDTFLSMKTLPIAFGNDLALFVTDGNNNPIWYAPIPFAQRYNYKDASRRYYVDLANGQFALTGKVPSGYSTIHLIHRKVSTDIASGTSWGFPSRFHPILGFLVAEMYKAGVDYDDIAARQMVQNRADAKVLYDVLVAWDDNLRAKELNNRYEESGLYDTDGFPSVDMPQFPLSLM